MRPYHLLLVVLIALYGLPTRAGAQPLVFHDGFVTIEAEEASIAQLLSAWARVGGTEIVNGEKVSGAVTVSFVRIPEAQALKTLLKSVGGYVLVPRRIQGAASESIYERILILPTSSAIHANARPAERPAAPAAWPMPVNRDEDLVFEDPIPAVVFYDKNAKQDSWPMPINRDADLVFEDRPKTKDVEPPASWPMPINDYLDDDDRVAAAPVPGSPTVSWPMPVNRDEDLNLTTETGQTTVVVGDDGIPALAERPSLWERPPTIGLRTVPGVALAPEPVPADRPSAK